MLLVLLQATSVHQEIPKSSQEDVHPWGAEVATRRTKIFKPAPGKCQLAAKPATRLVFHLPLFTWPTG